MPYKDIEKQKQAQHFSYLKNKEEIYRRSKKKKSENMKWLDEQKNKPCLDCGRQFPPYVMEFHHRQPKEKIMSIGRMIITRSRQKIIEEISKCDLVCSNCHRIREYGETYRLWLDKI
jgi:hypothetical protein